MWQEVRTNMNWKESVVLCTVPTPQKKYRRAGKHAMMEGWQVISSLVMYVQSVLVKDWKA